MASLACCVCDWSSNILAICFPVAQRREQPWWKHQGYFGYICKPKDKDGQRAEARHEKARQNVLILQSAWMLMMQTASCSTPCKFLSPRLLSYMLCAAAELPCYLLSKCNFCSLITQYYIHKSLVELLTFNSNANLSVCETVDELAPDRISSAGRSGLLSDGRMSRHQYSAQRLYVLQASQLLKRTSWRCTFTLSKRFASKLCAMSAETTPVWASGILQRPQSTTDRAASTPRTAACHPLACRGPSLAVPRRRATRGGLAIATGRLCDRVSGLPMPRARRRECSVRPSLPVSFAPSFVVPRFRLPGESEQVYRKIAFLSVSLNVRCTGK